MKESRANGKLAADRSVTPRPVLLASPRSEDAKAVGALLRGEPWMLLKAGTWYEALKVMGTVVVPVMLCDHDVPGLEWPNGLTKFRGVLRLPTVLLLSDMASSSLLDDVLRFGAFDVLSRPFSRDRLISTLEFARIQWEMSPRGVSLLGAGGT